MLLFPFPAIRTAVGRPDNFIRFDYKVESLKTRGLIIP